MSIYNPGMLESLHVAHGILKERGLDKDAENIARLIAEQKSVHGVETTMAEEPIEHRLRRAWLNGFREGVDRAWWGDGRWDQR